jgi:MFS family permease
MLGSITPLGERGRGQRWGVTVTAHVLGAVLAGAVLGAVLGGIGAVVLGSAPPAWRAAVLVAGVAIAVGLDLAVGPGRIPGARRQVNEDWLHRYRGWVYGVAFGAQLGVGVATFVTTATVYAALLAALLTASPALGAIVGGTFGLARGASVLVSARIEAPEQVIRLDARLRAWDRPSRWMAASVQAGLAVAAVAILAGGPR